MTTWIMLAVLAWGMLLALGSYLYGGNHAVWRAAIVLGVTAGFLSAVARGTRGTEEADRARGG